MWKSISHGEYLNDHKSYLGSSDLRRILRSPAHYRVQQSFSTSSQEFGTMVHSFALEPDIAEASYTARPELDRRTKAGKEAFERAELEAASTGTRLVRASDLDSAKQCAASVRKALGNASIVNDWRQVNCEISGFADNFHGINAKIRPDILSEHLILDLKTTSDIFNFQKSIFNYQYHLQMAYYCDVAQAIDGQKRRFLWVAVETEYPYGVMIFEPSPEVISKGREDYRKAIEEYKKCVEWDMWPSYSLNVQTVELPRWMND